MTRGFNAFALARTARAFLVARPNDDLRARGRAPGSHWFGPTRICMVTAAASALLLGTAVRDVSAAPQINRVSGEDCVLTSTTVGNLLTDLATAGIPGGSPETPEIAFVVVYSLNLDNDGQPVRVGGTNGFTGPVICVNDQITGIDPTTQTTDIPVPATGASSVTTLDAEDVFILRYRLNGGTNDGDVEKVLCHSTNENTDCFRISPLVDVD
jgi:hypothetical protein